MLRKLLFYITCTLCLGAGAQNACPPNLGFEQGSYDNWFLMEGQVDSMGSTALMTTVLGSMNHWIIERSTPVELDMYGKFPISSPNGSRYSVMIGSNAPDRSASQLGYTFQVPTNTTGYSVIFNYAVVLQNPDHEPHQQPKFSVRVFNLTDGRYIQCSSYDFVAGFSAPDFVQSDVDFSVYYKPWSSVTLNLGAYAGKTLQLEFVVNDCTLGAHFGYAYLDVNEICSDPITGSYICPGLSSTVLQAPGGFRDYEWFTGNMSTPLGSGSSLQLPNPVIGDSFAVVLIPHDYLGCRDTLVTRIKQGLEPINLVVKDSIEACQSDGINLTDPSIILSSTPNLTITYYKDPGATQYIPNPSRITEAGTYYIRGMNSIGCVIIRPVKVKLFESPVFNVADPPVLNYPEYVNLTTIPDNPEYSYSYWEDFQRTRPVLNPAMIQTSGIYYINATSGVGCRSIKQVNVRIKPKIFVPNAFTPNKDGKNDVFVYKASGGISGVQYFNIYNRWGEIVFSTNKPGQGWDGTYKGKLQPNGTYIWMFEIRDVTGTKHIQRGVVTLIH